MGTETDGYRMPEWYSALCVTDHVEMEVQIEKRTKYETESYSNRRTRADWNEYHSI